MYVVSVGAFNIKDYHPSWSVYIQSKSYKTKLKKRSKFLFCENWPIKMEDN